MAIGVVGIAVLTSVGAAVAVSVSAGRDAVTEATSPVGLVGVQAANKKKRVNKRTKQ